MNDWIICTQRPETLKKYPGPVVWILKCLHCGEEEPSYEGLLDVVLFQSKKFTERHKDCKAAEGGTL